MEKPLISSLMALFAFCSVWDGIKRVGVIDSARLLCISLDVAKSRKGQDDRSYFISFQGYEKTCGECSLRKRCLRKENQVNRSK
jgi:hypothetical protein